MQQILLVAVPYFALTLSLCIALSRLDKALLTAATSFELCEPPATPSAYTRLLI